MDIQRMKRLYKELDYILNTAASVDDCSEEENQIYSDIANLKNSIENANLSCKDCPYYYGEIDWCMLGEPDVPDNMAKKCEEAK